ncbi:MAG TPA: hypothetical protein PLW94_01100 [Candidatus Absconditabacterales bacterium]|nr:hypothetical protein [Candidatus Absconditabacterales bacterium]
MEQVFNPAMSHDYIINIGKNKKTVGDTILREKTVIEVGGAPFQPACFINNVKQEGLNEQTCIQMGGQRKTEIINVHSKAPLIVRITKFLLRMTIVLSISMIIFNSVKYMIEVLGGKDRKSAESKKNLIYVVSGIMLALLSVSVINLIISIPKSSIKTSDDLSAFEIGCKTGSIILVGNDLKEQICLKSTFGHPQGTMQFRERKYLPPFSMSADKMEAHTVGGYRCKICEGDGNSFDKNCMRKRIYNSEMKTKCVEDLGGSIVN